MGQIKGKAKAWDGPASSPRAPGPRTSRSLRIILLWNPHTCACGCVRMLGGQEVMHRTLPKPPIDRLPSCHPYLQTRAVRHHHPAQPTQRTLVQDVARLCPRPLRRLGPSAAAASSPSSFPPCVAAHAPPPPPPRRRPAQRPYPSSSLSGEEGGRGRSGRQGPQQWPRPHRRSMPPLLLLLLMDAAAEAHAIGIGGGRPVFVCPVDQSIVCVCGSLDKPSLHPSKSRASPPTLTAGAPRPRRPPRAGAS